MAPRVCESCRTAGSQNVSRHFGPSLRLAGLILSGCFFLAVISVPNVEVETEPLPLQA